MVKVGRASANEILKRFRLTSEANEVDLTYSTVFEWRAWIQNHNERQEIITEGGIRAFLWRRLPGIVDPGDKGLGDRCDFVVVRVDGTAARLHPHATSEDKVGKGE